MKRIDKVSLVILVFIALIALFFSCGKAEAQEMGLIIQPQVVAEKNAAATERLVVDVYAGTGRIGLWGFGYGERGYFSIVAGPYATLMQKGDVALEVGIGAGIENYTQPFDELSGRYARYASYVALEGPKGILQYYYETGSTKESWTQAEATWQVSDHFAIGAFHQTGDGTGPRVIVKLPKLPLKLWAGPMFGEGKKFMAGMNLSFEK